MKKIVVLLLLMVSMSVIAERTEVNGSSKLIIRNNTSN